MFFLIHIFFHFIVQLLTSPCKEYIYQHIGDNRPKFKRGTFSIIVKKIK